ncbi:hypothetical protein D9M72_656920 [compost metagenome]
MIVVDAKNVMNDAGTDTAPRPAAGVEDEDTLPRAQALDSTEVQDITEVDTEELPEAPGDVLPADAPDPASDSVTDTEGRHDGLK